MAFIVVKDIDGTRQVFNTDFIKRVVECDNCLEIHDQYNTVISVAKDFPKLMQNLEAAGLAFKPKTTQVEQEKFKDFK